jgi:hypothetical protein
VQPGGQVKITNGFNTIRTTVLNIFAGGDVDLGKGKVIVDWSGSSPVGSWNGSQYTGLIGHVQAGRGDGSWNGLGIRTSQSDATTSLLTTVAIAEAVDVLGLGAGETATWRGQLVDADSVLIAYTWGGDADLNGELNGDDYFFIDANVVNSGSVFGFNKGDFDYNGAIDGDDYFIIDSNITFAQNSPPFNSGPGAGGLAPVPEPAGIGMMTTAMGLLLKRRRRRL